MDNLGDSEFEDCVEENEKDLQFSTILDSSFFPVPEIPEIEKSQSFKAPRRKRTVMEMAMGDIP